jgi:hypothetical protein
MNLTKKHIGKDWEFVEKETQRRRKLGERIDNPKEKISSYMSVIEKTHRHENPKIKERIKQFYHDRYVINSDEIPESYFENQRRRARELGHGDIEVSTEMRTELSQGLINDQKSTLDNWLEYFTSDDSSHLETWVKYWAFNGMTKLGSFNKEKDRFERRNKETVAPFPELNREALAYVNEIVTENLESEEVKGLVNELSFKKLYAHALKKSISLEEIDINHAGGEWVRYEKGANHGPFFQSLQGHGTGWCTASENTARKYLDNGDVFVFYSEDLDGKARIPRAAICMKGDRIAEVRGVAEQQNLDSGIIKVVEDKLGEFGREGKKFKARTEDMKKLTSLEEKISKEGELDFEELRLLYEIDRKIQGFGYNRDPRIDQMIGQRNKRKDISDIFECEEDEISFTKEEAIKEGVKYHYGDLYLGGLESAEGLRLPDSIGRDLYLGGLRSAEGLRLPESVGGNLYLGGLNSAEGLRLPESVGGNLYLGGLNSAEGLRLPESVGGNLYLNRLRRGKKDKLRSLYPNLAGKIF